MLVSIWWVVGALFVGVWGGFLLAALMVASNDKKEKKND